MAAAEVYGDARQVVCEGLRRVVARHGLPPEDAAGTRAWQNRLLDETGSDRRGLVQLLLRVHADGVLAGGALAESSPRPLAAAVWAPVRARLAFGYASATYLDAEMARWAVDAWAYALGVIDATGLWRPPAAVVEPPRAESSDPARAWPAIQPVPPGVAAQGQAPLAQPAGQRRTPPARVRRAAARAHGPPVYNPFPANFDRVAGGVFVGLVVLSAGAMWIGLLTRREAGGLEVAAAGIAPSTGTEPLASGPAGARPAPTAGRAEPVDATAAEDTLRLQDGTTRTGRITRITRGAVLLYDLWADAVATVDLNDVAEIRTRGGAVLPVGEAAPGLDTSPDRPVGGPAVDGVGGRYVVRQRLLAVEGSESCDVVAEAVRRAAARPTVEVVAHAPGTAAFTLESRPGVRGTVDADGHFRTEAVRGVRDGVHYWFQMAGRFDPRGFRAEAESATDAVLKYGSVQRCRVTAALDARRLP